MKQFKTRSNAFTLVELLVVIGIIALLISILLPALNSARKAANQTKCLSLMKNVGQAMMIYVTENNGSPPYTRATTGRAGDIQTHASLSGWEIPAWMGGVAYSTRDFANPRVYLATSSNGRAIQKGYPNFFGSLFRYMNIRNEDVGDAAKSAELKKNLLTCPEAVEWRIPFPHSYSLTPYSQTNYMFNGVMINRKFTKLRRAAAIVVLQESRYIYGNLAYRPLAFPPATVSDPTDPYSETNPDDFTFSSWTNTGATASNGRYAEYAEVHGRNKNVGGNFLYADGHCDFKPVLELRPTDFGLGVTPTSDIAISNPGAATDSVLTPGVSSKNYYASGLR